MLSIATYPELALGLLQGVVIARSLGRAEFGHYAFAPWACGTLITLSNNALTMSSIKLIAEARGAGRANVAAAELPASSTGPDEFGSCGFLWYFWGAHQEYGTHSTIRGQLARKLESGN